MPEHTTCNENKWGLEHKPTAKSKCFSFTLYPSLHHISLVQQRCILQCTVYICQSYAVFFLQSLKLDEWGNSLFCPQKVKLSVSTVFSFFLNVLFWVLCSSNLIITSSSEYSNSGQQQKNMLAMQLIPSAEYGTL